jgi:cell division protein FtsL
MLTRLNVMLAALLVLCALGLVTSQHHARKLFIDLERAQAHAAAHEVRWNQLQVEQTELAKSALIDARARRELGMQAVQGERTLHLSIDPVTRVVSLSQPWRELPVRSGAGGVPRAGAAGPGQPQAGGSRAARPVAGPAAGKQPAAGRGTGARPAAEVSR